MPGTEKERKTKASWLELEKLGVIEKVGPGEPTVWSSPLHLAPKADGSLRPVGDYRVLNSKTTPDNYPLPSLRHFSGNLKGAKIFSSIDLFRAYHQIELTRGASEKTTLVTPFGAYRFKR